LIAGYVVTAQPVATFESWQVGDVLAGVGDPYKFAPGESTPTTGLILRYPATGSLSMLNEPDGWYTTGCAYYPGPTAPELWTTSFGSTINRYDPANTAWTQAWIDVAAHSDGGSAESIAFAPDGSVFIGTPWSASGQIMHYTHGDPATNTPPTLINTYSNLMGGAADWVDVATESGDLVVYYTSENSVEDAVAGGDGAGVYKINITQTDLTGSNVETHIATIPDGKAWALRVLPRGQGLLVAGTTQIFWLGLNGDIRKTYGPGGVGFFALNISPDGEYFWTATSPPYADDAGHTTALASIYKVHISSGATVSTIDTSYASVAGLCVVREYTAAFDTCTNDAGQPIECRILEVCGNGIDDDGDGTKDAADPGCANTSDIDERSPTLPCDNGVDDDGDGRKDFDPATKADAPAFAAGRGDKGCFDSRWLVENPRCQNGLNDDAAIGTDFDAGVSILGAGNGDANGSDPQCANKPWRDNENPDSSCGIGFEIALVLFPLSARWRRRS
jgi:hypothetical protein